MENKKKINNKYGGCTGDKEWCSLTTYEKIMAGMSHR
jgi:hypothetical protein